MSTESTRPPVVIGIEGSTGERHAVRWAARTAAARHAPLRAVHVNRGTFETNNADHMADIQQLAWDVEPDLQVDVIVKHGDVTEVLRGQSVNAQLLVLATHGNARPLEGFWLSAAATLAASAHCPVVAVPRGPGRIESLHGPVVVGVDGSPVSEPALAFAFEHAALHGAELVAVHAWQDSALDVNGPSNDGLGWERVVEVKQEVLAERLAGWQDKYPDVRIRRVVSHDRAAHSLLSPVQPAQLLVVGFRGRGGLSGLLHGSTSQALLYQAPCPLAIIRTESK